MRWCLSSPGSGEYIIPVTLWISITPVYSYNCLHSMLMYLEVVIKRVWRFTWRQRLSKHSHPLGGRDRAWFQIPLETEGLSELSDAHGDDHCGNFETVIERLCQITRMLWLSDFGDAVGGRDRVNSEMHMEPAINPVGIYTWRPWLIEVGGVLGSSWAEGNWS